MFAPKSYLEVNMYAFQQSFWLECVNSKALYKSMIRADVSATTRFDYKWTIFFPITMSHGSLGVEKGISSSY